MGGGGGMKGRRDEGEEDGQWGGEEGEGEEKEEA